jgi:hypothetical protein
MQKMKLGRHIAACVLTLVAVLILGYLTAQTQGYAGGYLLGFDGLPAIAVTRRFAWELDFGMILFGIAAVFLYRKVAVAKSIEVTVLVTLIASFLIAGSFVSLADSAHGTPVLPAGPGGLLTLSFVSGGSSSFTLALLAGVVARLLLGHIVQTKGTPDVASADDNGTHAGSSSLQE